MILCYNDSNQINIFIFNIDTTKLGAVAIHAVMLFPIDIKARKQQAGSKTWKTYLVACVLCVYLKFIDLVNFIDTRCRSCELCSTVKESERQIQKQFKLELHSIYVIYLSIRKM